MSVRLYVIVEYISMLMHYRSVTGVYVCVCVCLCVCVCVCEYLNLAYGKQVCIY